MAPTFILYIVARELIGSEKLLDALRRGRIAARNRFSHEPISPREWARHAWRNRTIPADPANERPRPEVEFGEYPFDPAVDAACGYPEGIADIPPGSVELLRADLAALDLPEAANADEDEIACRLWLAALGRDETRKRAELLAEAQRKFPALSVRAFDRCWPFAPAHLHRPGRR